MSNSSIRAAKSADVGRIWELILELADYEKLSDIVSGSADLLGASLFGERPSAEALVAEAGGKIVGYAIFFTNFSTFTARPGIWLEDIYVQPECRGSGLGKAMLYEVAKIARVRGCARFEWVVLDWNEPSIRFYEALGAKRMPEWHICRLEGQTLADLGAVATEAP